MGYSPPNHPVHSLSYHIVFCPKRRKSVLVEDIVIDLKAIIESTISALGCQLQICEIMPDHVHLLVSAKPSVSPHKIVKSIKAASAKPLRDKYPRLRKIPAMWSNCYYACSVGIFSESIVKNYIMGQKGK